MTKELTTQLRMNNVMFGVIAAFVGIPYLMFSLLMMLLAGSVCVEYFAAPIPEKELWFSTVVSYGTLVAIVVTILTKGAWFKVLDIMYQDLLNAHKRHADDIKQKLSTDANE